MSGKKALFELTARQVLRLADVLDMLLADEEEEMGLKPAVVQPAMATQGAFGVVKWYNATKSFGFVTPDAVGEEAVVSKEARVTEEVVVRKEAEQRTETVSGTVRQTEVEVEDERGNRVPGTGTIDQT